MVQGIMASREVEALASSVAEYLTGSRNHMGRSPLQERMQIEISGMAAIIVKEVIDSMPEIRDRIEAMAQAAVVRALADDEYLRSVVAKAMGEGLGQLLRERELDR